MSTTPPSRPSHPETIEVEPDRLHHGRWCEQTDRYADEGDITGSYSGDRIGMDKPIRRPFIWHGNPWVCTGISNLTGPITAEAYRLVDPQAFDGTPVTYHEKVNRDRGKAAHNDPNGFYHGMTVMNAGKTWVLNGPPVNFAPGMPAQASLFGLTTPQRTR